MLPDRNPPPGPDYTDSTPPVLVISSPQNGTQVSDTSILVQGTASDLKGPGATAYASGVADVTCTLNGTQTPATSLTRRYATWSATVPLPAYVDPPGDTYVITVRATDYDDNFVEHTVSILAKDTTPPQIAITDPSGGYVISDTAFTVRGTASDESNATKLTSRINRITCTINGAAFNAVPDTPGNWNNWHADVTVPAQIAAAGTQYTVTAQVFDNVNLSAQATATYQAKDNTPPTLNLLQPQHGTSIYGTDTGANVLFAGTVSDTFAGAKLASGVQFVRCSVDGGLEVNAALVAAPDGMQWSATLAFSSLGEHTVTLRWGDAAGNTSLRLDTIAIERHPSQNKGVMTPASYLADLLDYVARRVVDGGNVPLDPQALTAAFLQPMDVAEDQVHQLRIAIEVLRRWLRPGGYWAFDEGTGKIAKDAGRGGSDGTLQGASGPVWIPGGKIGGALAFDGVDNVVTVAATPALKAIVNTFTIAFWTNPAAQHEIDPQSTTGAAGTSGERYAIGPEHGGTAYGSPDHAGVGVSVGTNGISVYEHSDGYLPAPLVYQANLAGWTHVAVVYSQGTPTLYVNGAFAKQGLTSPKLFVHTRPAGIGGMSYGFYKGQLDDVRVYDHALSAEAIDALAKATTATAANDPRAQASLDAERTYRREAYLSLLTRIGTSFDEIRLARTAQDRPSDTPPRTPRADLATRLGIVLTVGGAGPRNDELDQLLLDPETFTERDLERLFGLAVTSRPDGSPTVDPIAASSLLHWQRGKLLTDWKVADLAAEWPVIDPDIVTVADLANPKTGNRAFDIWSDRRAWTAAQLSALKAKREAQATPLAGIDNVFADTWGPTAVADLQSMATARQRGTNIDADLATKHLDARAFLRLMRIHDLAAQPSATVLASEWDDVYSILVQARKGQQTVTWKEIERQRNLVLDDDDFVLADPLAPSVLPSWRARASTRQQWVATLQARIDQAQSLIDGLMSAVDATEQATLPILRDALVRAVGTDVDLPDRLTKRLLIDVQDSGYRETTRVDQAIATVQELLFSLRAGRAKDQDPIVGGNPAAGWHLSRNEHQFDEEWTWLGSFGSWRAAMFVYQYPENVLYPHLREPATMTPAFRTFLSDVRGKGRLTPADARNLALSYLGAPRDYGLVGDWGFDEGSGSTATDSTEWKNTATLQPTPNRPVWTTGRRGSGGLGFDGVHDYIEIPHVPSLDIGSGNSDFVVSFWILLRRGPVTPPLWRVVMHKGTEPERTLAMFLHPDSNQLHFRISTSADKNVGGDSQHEIPLNRWTHVAYVKSGPVLRLYINGLLDGEVGLASPVTSNTGPIRIGWDTNQSFPTADMVLDEVRVFRLPPPPGLSPFGTPSLPGDLFYRVYGTTLTDGLDAGGLDALRALSRDVMQPYVDPATKTLRPDTPAYLVEIFYFVPLHLALQLQKSGQYLAALDWYRTVYAYDLPIDRRKIFFGLEAEKNIATSFESGSDLWLPNDINPHVIASQRAGANTRFTLLALTRCFLEFADAEFTRDSYESLPRARTLYLAALELLALDEMAPVAAPPASGVVPPNPVAAAMRGHALLNLVKMRQGRNVAGMQRQIPPEALPAIPSGAAGANGTAPRTTVPLRPTPYYYSVLIERAKQLVNLSQQVETAYLSALEKRDAEAYSLLKAGQDLALAKAGVDLQALRVTEADLNVTLAHKQRDRAQVQAGTYSDWIATGPSDLENSVLDDYWTATQYRQIIAGTDAAITIAQAFESVAGAGIAAGAAAVPAGVISDLSIVRGGLTIAMEDVSTRAQVNAIRASQERRAQEWQLQLNLANQDELISDQQIAIAGGQHDIAKQEQTIAALQKDNAQVTVNFLATKFTNAELYEWMSGVLRDVYSYFLQQASAVAQLAQMQLAFERQGGAASFIQADYWEAPNDSGTQAASSTATPDRRGLTGSARLLQDIYQLDQFAFSTNKRKLQLSQTFSLASHGPAEFQQFRETGQLVFATPMRLFDSAFPGHYLRLIRRVRTSVIALVSPTQGIRASLTAGGISRVVIGGDQFQTALIRRDPELVALTTTSNATGLFELDVQSEMLLPFEGMGVDTNWEFRLPKAANGFDYRSIADVIFTIEYTALNSFDYREQVIRTLPTFVSADRAISVRRQFADQWYDLNNPSQSAQPMVIHFTLTADDFPPNLDELRIDQLLVHFSPGAAGPSAPIEVSVADFRAPVTPVGPARAANSRDGTISTRRSGGASWAPLLGASPVGDWELKLANDAATMALFANGSIDDILLVVTYTGRSPDWLT